MMYEVMEQLVPQHVANCHGPPVCERDLIIERFIVDVLEARDSLFVNAAVPGCKLFDLSRALEIGYGVVVAEVPFGHAITQASVDFGEVPRELGSGGRRVTGIGDCPGPQREGG